eukprot:1158151-Pelagomonas_calceolata.AAC.6
MARCIPPVSLNVISYVVLAACPLFSGLWALLACTRAADPGSRGGGFNGRIERAGAVSGSAASISISHFLNPPCKVFHLHRSSCMKRQAQRQAVRHLHIAFPSPFIQASSPPQEQLHHAAGVISGLAASVSTSLFPILLHAFLAAQEQQARCQAALQASPHRELTAAPRGRRGTKQCWMHLHNTFPLSFLRAFPSHRRSCTKRQARRQAARLASAHRIFPILPACFSICTGAAAPSGRRGVWQCCAALQQAFPEAWPYPGVPPNSRTAYGGEGGEPKLIRRVANTELGTLVLTKKCKKGMVPGHSTGSRSPHKGPQLLNTWNPPQNKAHDQARTQYHASSCKFTKEIVCHEFGAQTWRLSCPTPAHYFKAVHLLPLLPYSYPSPRGRRPEPRHGGSLA